MSRADELRTLLGQRSKHSDYQVLAHRLREHLPGECKPAKSRHEQERLAFIAATLELANRRVLDVGANAGFFTFEALAMGAREVVVYEGNPILAEFVRLAAELLEVGSIVEVHQSYLDPLRVGTIGPFDVTFLMNVLHHVGDDYGAEPADIGGVQASIVEAIRRLAGITRNLVLQLGYCWKGNRNLPLFERGTKQEQVDLVAKAADGCWRLLATGIPEGAAEGIVYRPLCATNSARNDALGEFLNRPVFVLRSQVLD